MKSSHTRAALAAAVLVSVGAAQVRTAYFDQFCTTSGYSCTTYYGSNTRRIGAAAAALGDLDGDGRADFAVAAPHEPLPNSYSGLASGRVRVMAGGAYSVLVELQSTQNAARFGEAIANVGDMDGDGFPELAVGAPYHDQSGSNVGLVRVYKVWPTAALPAVLVSAAGAVAEARLGSSLSGGLDVDGDGFPDFVAGAPNDNRNGANAGEVRVVSSAAGGTTIHSVLGSAGGLFGYAVLLLDDMDGDGRAEFLATAPLFGGIATQQGRATIRSGLTGALLHTLDGASASDEFGRAAARLGDLDGDGQREFAIGAPRESIGALFSAGRVYVYRGSDATLLTVLHGTRYNERFGTSVDGAGDLDLDGVPDLLVGGPYDSVNGTEAGVAIAFSGATFAPIFESLGERAGDRFGACVAGVGDVDGDGFPDAMFGAPLAARYWGGGTSTIGVENGAVYIESVDAIPTDPAVKARIRQRGYVYAGVEAIGDGDGDGFADYVHGLGDSSQPNTVEFVLRSGARSVKLGSTAISGTYAFGSTLSAVGDVNGDGTRDVAIGVPYGATADGAAIVSSVLVRSGVDMGPLYAFAAPVSGALVGEAVDPVGDLDGDGIGEIVVSTRQATCVTYVLSGATGATLRTHLETTNSWPEESSSVGDVDGDGTADYLIGYPRENFTVGFGYAGAARVRSGATGALLRTHGASGGAASVFANFGYTVSGLGDVDFDGVPDYAVGAPLDGVFGYRHGSVTAFSGASGAALWSTAGVIVATENWAGARVRRLRDFDGDGVDDVAMLRSSLSYATPHPTYGAQFLSGATGAVLRDLPGIGFSSVADVDGDGVDELLGSVGEPAQSNSSVEIRSLSYGATRFGRPRDAGQSLALGWFSAAGPAGAVALEGGAPFQSAWLLASLEARAAFVPSYAVDFYVGLADPLFVPLALDGAGAANLPLGLGDPALAGMVVCAQAFAPSSPTTGAWSNGLALKFGD